MHSRTKAQENTFEQMKGCLLALFFFVCGLNSLSCECPLLPTSLVFLFWSKQLCSQCVLLILDFEGIEQTRRHLQYAGLGCRDAIALKLLPQLPVVFQLALEAHLCRHGLRECVWIILRSLSK